jgi:N utilization substance protein A
MQLKAVVDTVSKDKNLKKEVVVSAIKHALERSMKKSFPYGRLEVSCDDNYNFKVYHFKSIVDSEPEMLDEESEVTIQEARKIDSKVEIGDEMGFEVSTDLGRIEANLAKQAISEVIKHAESLAAYNQFKDLKGKIVSGVVQTADKKGALILLGVAEGYLPRSEMIFQERVNKGQTYEFLLKEIELSDKGQLKLILSRSSPMFVVAALREEVPEILNGEVELVSCVRDAGKKTKVVVDTDFTSVNPASVCIGSGGTRIQKVMQRIGGERVDIVAYSDDLPKFLQGLLSGVNIRHVKEDFARAIGRDGINVKLASQILGKKVVLV